MWSSLDDCDLANAVRERATWKQVNQRALWNLACARVAAGHELDAAVL